MAFRPVTSVPPHPSMIEAPSLFWTLPVSGLSAVYSLLRGLCLSAATHGLTGVHQRKMANRKSAGGFTVNHTTCMPCKQHHNSQASASALQNDIFLAPHVRSHSHRVVKITPAGWAKILGRPKKGAERMNHLPQKKLGERDDRPATYRAFAHAFFVSCRTETKQTPAPPY